jgi:nucleoside-triphosphatase
MVREALMNPSNILITGPPGCGKSTVVEKVVERIDRPATGFFTREIGKKGRRVGFSITTLDGRQGVLAHEDTESPWRVSKYGVNAQHIHEIAVPSMIPADNNQIVVIDEIGKMECMSSKFRETLIRVLDSPNLVIGSISQKGSAFIHGIKERSDVKLIHVTPHNRDFLVEEIVNFLA